MSSLLTTRPRLVFALFLIALLSFAAIYFRLAQFDPFYRTIFVEEMNSGEAGRAMALFGEWKGEGGRWQSAPVVPAGTAVNWMAFELNGVDKVSLRYTYITFAIAGLALMARVLRQTSPVKPELALLGFLALGLSPLMLHVLSSALNEALFLFCVSLPMALVTLRGGVRNWRNKHAGMFALATVSALPVLVKLDGAIIPIAVTMVVFLAWLRGDMRFSHVVTFLATGIVAALAFGFSTYLLFGGEQLTDIRLMISEMNEANPNLNPNTKMRIERTYVWFPRNLEMYLPGASLAIAFAVAIVASGFGKLTFATRIALFILVGYFLLSFNFPLIYWKRVLLIVPCAIIVLLAATQSAAPVNLKHRVLIGVAAAASFIWGTVAIASRFKGMWRIEAAWELDHWPAVAAVGAIGAFACLGICLFGKQRCLMNTSFALICVATIGSSIFELSRERTTRAGDIGREMSAYLNGSTVVADHQAFRFFGYYTDARVRFTQENDPAFPEQIFADVNAIAPDYVVVTDSYRLPHEKVLESTIDYDLVTTYRHSFPVTRFLSTPYTINIYVYARAPVAEQFESEGG